MKDIIKYISLLILIVFSFYYTDKISTMIIYKSDLMQEIISSKENEEKSYTNAIIDGKYIIPGINGLEVNELDSYYQMKKDLKYSRNKLVFNEVEPEMSIEQNKHLVINRGNQAKKAVAIILEDNLTIEKYCEENSVKISKIVTYEEFDKESVFEQLNNDDELDRLDLLLDKYKMNTNICLVNNQNKEKCEKNKKYLVEATYEVSNLSIAQIVVNAGDIILIDSKLALSNFKVLLKKVHYRDLDIIFLSELISEKRTSD